MVGDDL